MRRTIHCGILLAALSFLPAERVEAAPCVTASLATYVSLGATGCTIDVFTAKDFGFDNSVFAGGYIPFASSSITVTPLVSGFYVQFGFSGPFSVTGTESGTYVMTYTLDPPPILTGMEDDLLTNTPVAPGIVTITTDLCIGAAFTPPPLGTTCGGTPAALSVFHAGSSSGTHDEIVFAATSILGVRHSVVLTANGASASFTGVQGSTVASPEPATIWSGAVLALLGLWRAKRRQP